VLPTADVVMLLRVQRERMDDVFYPSTWEYFRWTRPGCSGCRSTRS